MSARPKDNGFPEKGTLKPSSKSQHKRICIQSKCVVREELKQQLAERDKTIKNLNRDRKIIEEVSDRRADLLLRREKELQASKKAVVELVDFLNGMVDKSIELKLPEAAYIGIKEFAAKYSDKGE